MNCLNYGGPRIALANRPIGAIALKTKTTEENDRNRQPAVTTIPYLPDNIIEKILSFLPIDRAAQANTVSKQWATIWPSFPVIDLDEERFSEPHRFLSFMHHSLRRCSNQKHLDKLRVRANIDYGDIWVWIWLEFAIKRRVKELDILDLDEFKTLGIHHDILTLESLTSLKLENVRIESNSGSTNHPVIPVSLPLLKTMFLIDVRFDNYGYSLCALVSGCPCMEHLSIQSCVLVDIVEISSNSLKCLDIRHCISEKVAVTAKNLESFTLYSDVDPYHKTVFLLQCDNLKHVDIYSVGLKKLILHSCLNAMENSINTPSLEYFQFSGYLKAKVHFVEPPSNLLRATIRIWGDSWPVEYYSAMRDFLESFDFSEEVKLHILDAQCLIIPEDCRMEWSPPLPTMKQLQLYCSATPMHIKCMEPSLIWMAPSAEISLFPKDEDNDEDDNDNDNDDEDDEEDVDEDEDEDEDDDDDDVDEDMGDYDEDDD